VNEEALAQWRLLSQTKSERKHTFYSWAEAFEWGGESYPLKYINIYTAFYNILHDYKHL
jgi:hypothetical protein